MDAAHIMKPGDLFRAKRRVFLHVENSILVVLPGSKFILVKVSAHPSYLVLFRFSLLYNGRMVGVIETKHWFRDCFEMIS